MKRKLLILERYPTAEGECGVVAKIGTEDEILAYLKEDEAAGLLGYFEAIFEIKEEAIEESENWLEEEGDEIKVKAR